MSQRQQTILSSAHVFPRKILPNSTGQLAKFRCSLWQNRPNCAVRHGRPFMTENWESCSETSVVEGWHCTRRSMCTSRQHASTYRP